MVKPLPSFVSGHPFPLSKSHINWLLVLYPCHRLNRTHRAHPSRGQLLPVHSTRPCRLTIRTVSTVTVIIDLTVHIRFEVSYSPSTWPTPIHQSSIKAVSRSRPVSGSSVRLAIWSSHTDASDLSHGLSCSGAACGSHDHCFDTVSSTTELSSVEPVQVKDATS